MPSGECELSHASGFGVKKAGMPRVTVVRLADDLDRPVQKRERIVRRTPARRAPRSRAAAPSGSPGVAGDQRGVDGADRRSDHPVGLDAGLVQRLVDADLIGAERAAALQHEHDLPGNVRPARRRARTPLPLRLRELVFVAVMVLTSVDARIGLLRGPAAVDRDDRAGDRRGFVACEKGGERRHFRHLHELLGRLRVQQHVVDDLRLR